MTPQRRLTVRGATLRGLVFVGLPVMPGGEVISDHRHGYEARPEQVYQHAPELDRHSVRRRAAEPGRPQESGPAADHPHEHDPEDYFKREPDKQAVGAQRPVPPQRGHCATQPQQPYQGQQHHRQDRRPRPERPRPRRPPSLRGPRCRCARLPDGHGLAVPGELLTRRSSCPGGSRRLAAPANRTS